MLPMTNLSCPSGVPVFLFVRPYVSVSVYVCVNLTIVNRVRFVTCFVTFFPFVFHKFCENFSNGCLLIVKT